MLRRILLSPTVLLLVTAADGAVLTFAPQFTATPALAATCLLALTATTAVTRWGCGALADRIALATGSDNDIVIAPAASNCARDSPERGFPTSFTEQK